MDIRSLSPDQLRLQWAEPPSPRPCPRPPPLLLRRPPVICSPLPPTLERLRGCGPHSLTRSPPGSVLVPRRQAWLLSVPEEGPFP